MQEDMHYYGTYAMARAAGLEVKHAKVSPKHEIVVL